MKKITLLIITLIFSFSIYSQTSIITENFEGTNPPTDWSTTSNGDGWLFGVCGGPYWIPPSHTNYAYVNDADAGQSNDASTDYLITPELDLSSYSAVIFKCEVFHDGYSPQGASPIATIEASTDGGNNWNVVDTIQYEADWHSVVVSLSDYVGQSSVKVAIRFNDLGVWTSGMAVDDIEIYEPSPYDVGMISINNQDFIQNGNVNLLGTIKNFGSVEVNNLDISWSIDNGTTVNTDNLTGLSIAAAQTYDFTHSIPIDMSTTQNYNVKVWVSNPNGNSDGNNINDTITKSLVSISQVPQKVVVGEEGTGTWCGWCPGGTVSLKNLKHYYPDSWIGISIHHDDPMVETEYDNTLYPGKLTGLPGGLIDRKNHCEELGVTEFEAGYQERVVKTTPVAVNISNIDWNNSTRELSFDIEATFYTNIDGDFRINAVVTEDEVTGTDNNWDQHNYYHNVEDLIDWEGINWKNLPDPVPAANMVYNDVARKIFGGWSGTAGSIPSSVVDGTVYSHSYSYVFPDTMDENHFNIIGMVIDQNSEEIINAKLTPLIISSVQTKYPYKNVMIFPNPSKGLINIVNARNSKIEIFNINGQKIKEITNYSNFETIDLSNNISGIYIVKIINNESIITKKININR